MNERELQHEIVDFLNKSGKAHAWLDRQVSMKPGRGTFHSSNGVSDVLAVVNGGTFIAIEVKMKEGRLKPSQLRFLEAVSARGAIAMVATSIEQVQEELSDILTCS
jgi:Holliday junction resolvase